jgi:hypothetical protein
MKTSFDISMLDRNTRDELFLTWLSCTNFKALNNAGNKESLNSVWAFIKNKLNPFFQNQEITFNVIAKDFREFVLNINPNLSFSYDPEKNSLYFNLWTIFFDADANAMIPSLPWKLAGELVHEHDHYLLLDSMEMIGKDKETQDTFFAKNWGKAEIRAFIAQAIFLKNCKERISSAVVEEFRITGWTLDGKPLPGSYYKLMTVPKTKMLEQIDSCIAEYTNKIEQIKKGFSYPKAAVANDNSFNLKTARLLSLPINLKNLKEPFAEIKLKI